MKLGELEQLINTSEDDHHDFKQHWYHKGQKPEMVKDIFSFVNTDHHDDCFLVIGVNDNREVTGVENDGNDRLNQQQLIDFIRSLPISGDFIPRLKIETVQYVNHEIDIIRIIDTFNVPIFLDRRWNEKGKPTNSINAGQIFVREQDVNTAKNSTADYNQVQKLWMKHFRMDLSIIDKYKYVLSDVKHWSYTEFDKYVFRYNLNPDFYMELVEDDIERNRIEAYSISQVTMKMERQWLKLKFRQSIIDKFLVVWLDGTRCLVVTPNMSVIKNNIKNHDSKSYYYFIRTSLNGKVEELLESGLPLKNSHQLSAFHNDVVFYNSKGEKILIERMINDNLEFIIKFIKASNKNIEELTSQVKTEISDDTESSPRNIKYILEQKKLGEIINKVLKYYRQNKKEPCQQELEYLINTFD